MPGRPDSDPARYWDAVAAEADGLPPGWRRQARAEHLALIRRWVGEPRGRWLKTDLFEERSADRALLPFLATASWVGTDVSPAVAAQALARVDGRAAVADIRRTPFPAGTFDGILSTSTLDHFDDPDDVGRSLVELHRILRPGGRLVLTLDNPRNPLVRLRNALPDRVARRTGLVPFAVGHTLAEGPGVEALVAARFSVEATAHVLHAPHVIGTRLARFGWYERRVLPRFEALARTRVAPFSGHFVAFLARA